MKQAPVGTINTFVWSKLIIRSSGTLLWETISLILHKNVSFISEKFSGSFLAALR